MSDPTTELIAIERGGLADMLEAIAVARETDAKAADDPRYGVAARSIRAIASTLDQVDDALMVTIAVIDRRSEGVVSKLIAVRLCALGFESAPVDSAVAFFGLFMDMIETAGRKRLN